ncbi:hypothetical protein OPT61_g8874 [Boeremia exigua]|uniref:Uncharacterized protein n=1 Tax=Boeremia exigua TaxID=749465 RepID=A0ACC2HWJ1_9PLEO|nr:hypothetical protein OPT61_g8874 [Boeremia exigua]
MWTLEHGRRSVFGAHSIPASQQATRNEQPSSARSACELLSLLIMADQLVALSDAWLRRSAKGCMPAAAPHLGPAMPSVFGRRKQLLAGSVINLPSPSSQTTPEPTHYGAGCHPMLSTVQ